jgi:hypothetical protein
MRRRARLARTANGLASGGGSYATAGAFQPNRETAEQDGALAFQLSMIAGDEAPTMRLDVRWQTAEGPMRRQWFGVRDFGRATRAIRNLQQVGDTYVGVAPRARDGGTARDAQRVWYLWRGRRYPRGICSPGAIDPAPTMAIKTRRGAHAYWRLLSPLSPDWAQRANRRVVKAVGGDPFATDAARILRPAGSLKWKYEPPRLVRCVALTGGAYTAADVVGGLVDDDRCKVVDSGASRGAIRVADRQRSLDGVSSASPQKRGRPSAITNGAGPAIATAGQPITRAEIRRPAMEGEWNPRGWTRTMHLAVTNLRQTGYIGNDPARRTCQLTDMGRVFAEAQRWEVCG